MTKILKDMRKIIIIGLSFMLLGIMSCSHETYPKQIYEDGKVYDLVSIKKNWDNQKWGIYVNGNDTIKFFPVSKE